MDTGNLLFVVGLVVVIGGIIAWIATISSRAKKMSAASDARLAAQLQEFANNPPAAPKPFADETPAERTAQVIAMAGDDDAPPAAASSTKGDRLAELAELHSAGSITDDELAAARATILAE